MANSFTKSSVIMLVMTSCVLCLDPSASSESDKSISASNLITDTNAKEFRKCPPPYTHILGECFYIHMYIPLMNWEEANTFCKQAGGQLAEPKHFGAVIAQIYNNGMADKIFRGVFNRLWLGGHRVGNSTNFEWSSGRAIEDPVVEGDDPYYTDGEGNCIMMIMHKDRPFELRAAACTIKTHYICQLQ